MLFKPILGHKHGGKHLREYLSTGLLIIVILAVAAIPPEALAFEAQLANSPSQKLVVIVELKGDGRPAVAGVLPNYTYRTSGTLIAYPPVETAPGNWSTRRVAYAVPAQQLQLPLVLEGEASYYSRTGCLGCSPALTMANGQPLDDAALTMAIGADKKNLVGHTATVTNVATGQSVEVKITDTGGFHHARYGNRVADLTVATKQAIGMRGGVGQVRVVVH